MQIETNFKFYISFRWRWNCENGSEGSYTSVPRRATAGEDSSHVTPEQWHWQQECHGHKESFHDKEH